MSGREKVIKLRTISLEDLEDGDIILGSKPGYLKLRPVEKAYKNLCEKYRNNLFLTR